ncbi:hypothetical protein F0251_23275 [Vibrio sp. 070316B]|uniref:hypothetical protein n=1 Tax=Vibrio sp. 070316B TaxID=2607608 RepID=UPI00149372EB|nr:hypothetical protein [Vibrio sp. 070316B]NOI41333.1 hypothetical protein [Vibrio sp. 070316B]
MDKQLFGFDALEQKLRIIDTNRENLVQIVTGLGQFIQEEVELCYTIPQQEKNRKTMAHNEELGRYKYLNKGEVQMSFSTAVKSQREKTFHREFRYNWVIKDYWRCSDGCKKYYWGVWGKELELYIKDYYKFRAPANSPFDLKRMKRYMQEFEYELFCSFLRKNSSAVYTYFHLKNQYCYTFECEKDLLKQYCLFEGLDIEANKMNVWSLETLKQKIRRYHPSLI